MDRRSSLRSIGGTVAGATLGSIWGSARAARPDNREGSEMKIAVVKLGVETA